MERDLEISNTKERLNFFGTITASVTHELNNVLSIINELIGLFDDQIYGSTQGMEINPEKLKSIHDRLLKQSGRGQQIIKNLNSFAHTVDEEILDFDLNVLTSNIAELSKRFVKLQKSDIEIQVFEKPIMITGKPFDLQRIIFLAIKRLVEYSGVGSVIKIGSFNGEDSPRIEISVKAAENKEPFEIGKSPAIEAILKNIDAKIETKQNSDSVLVNIIIPFIHRL